MIRSRKILSWPVENSAFPGDITLDSEELNEISQRLKGIFGEGTVDQLGFGPFFDDIAKSLFPWCSTLTTRIKYFLWTPAVLAQAVEIQVQAIMGDTTRDQLSEAKLEELRTLHRSTKLQKTIERVESTLAIALHMKYANVQSDTESLGIFGSRNLKMRIRSGVQSTQKLISGRGGGLLGSAARYPNSIYWNSLRTLKALAPDVLSKTDVITCLVEGERPWSDAWDEAIEHVWGLEIRPIWQALGDHHGAPQDKITRPWLARFAGFDLASHQRKILINAILESTLFWKPILTKGFRPPELDADAYKHFSLQLKDPVAKAQCRVAALAIEVCTPFREIYNDLARGRTEAGCNDYDWQRLQAKFVRMQKTLKNPDGSANRSTNRLFAFMTAVFVEQTTGRTNSPSKPSRRTVSLIIEREREVLNSRGKGSKRRLVDRVNVSQNGYQRGANRPRESEVVPATFRLSAAMRFIRDLDSSA